jgi:hypothetical protein
MYIPIISEADAFLASLQPLFFDKLAPKGTVAIVTG